MKWVVKWAAGDLYLLEERVVVAGFREMRGLWVELSGATRFASEADAWAGFDRDPCGKREDYKVLPIS